MATQLGQAYVQIIPTAKGISGNITKELNSEAGNAGSSAGELLGGNLVKTIIGVVAAAGIGSVIKNTISEALEAGGNLQQSFGGLETIYGNASDQMKKYAQDAQKMGISMNDFAEQAVSMGAALKNSLGGDTALAADKANIAIKAMADNSAKMGTNLESLKNAYTGFSRGNFTMLDNLSLGYAGTKEGMQQLLVAAEEYRKSQGETVKYSIDSYADIVDAIQAVQEKMGVAGVAAAEAEETLSGSAGAMKASFENLMASLTTGGDVGGAFRNLVDSAFTYVGKNMLPMVMSMFESLPTLIPTVLGSLVKGINFVQEIVPELGTKGKEVIVGIFEALKTSVPIVFETVSGIFKDIFSNAFNSEPVITVEDIQAMLAKFVELMQNNASQILSTDDSIIKGVAESILNNISGIYESGMEIVFTLIDSLIGSAGQLSGTVMEVINKMADIITMLLPMFAEKGMQILTKLIDGIVAMIPGIAEIATRVIMKFIFILWEMLPTILSTGITLIVQLIAGIMKAMPQLALAAYKVIITMVDEIIHYDWIGLATDMWTKLGNALINSGGILVDAVKNVVTGALNVGKQVASGLKDVFSGNEPEVQYESYSTAAVYDAVAYQASSYNSAADAQSYGEDTYYLLRQYLPSIAENNGTTSASSRTFNELQQESARYQRLTGERAFA